MVGKDGGGAGMGGGGAGKGGGKPTPMSFPLVLKKHGSATAGCIHCNSKHHFKSF